MKIIFKKKKYLIVAIAVLIMLSGSLVRTYYRHQIKKNLNLYNEASDHIDKDKNYKKAIEKFEAYRKFDPRDPDGLYSIGYCHFMLGDFEKAIEYLKDTIDMDPLYFQALEYLALAYIETGNSGLHSEAMDLIEKSRMILKKDSYIWSKIKEMHQETRAWLLFNLGNKDNALKIYQNVIPTYSRSFNEDLNEFDECFAVVHYHFGLIHLNENDLSEARTSFEKAIKAGGPQNIFSKRSAEEYEKLKNQIPSVEKL